MTREVLSRSTFDGHFIANSPEETFDLGSRLGAAFLGGEIVLLTGPLGAGKTVFAKGMAHGLEIDHDEVVSPTFTLVNFHAGRLPFYHIDLYRLAEGPEVAFAVGLDELLDVANSVLLIEWSERLGSYRFLRPIIRVVIEGDGDEPRHIEFQSV